MPEFWKESLSSSSSVTGSLRSSRHFRQDSGKQRLVLQRLNVATRVKAGELSRLQFRITVACHGKSCRKVCKKRESGKRHRRKFAFRVLFVFVKRRLVCSTCLSWLRLCSPLECHFLYHCTSGERFTASYSTDIYPLLLRNVSQQDVYMWPLTW